MKEQDFENLFDGLISLIMNNGDQKNRKLNNAVFDIYEIKDYVPEIAYYQKLKFDRIVFRYDDNNNIDLEYTLISIYSFFKLYRLDTNRNNDLLIDTVFVSNTILPALELLIKYIESEEK